MTKSNGVTPWEAWRDGMLLLAGIFVLLVLTGWEWGGAVQMWHNAPVPWGWWLASVVLFILILVLGSFAERFAALRNGLFVGWCITTLVVWSVAAWLALPHHLAWVNLSLAKVGLALPWLFAPVIALTQWAWRALERREAQG